MSEKKNFGDDNDDRESDAHGQRSRLQPDEKSDDQRPDSDALPRDDKSNSDDIEATIAGHVTINEPYPSIADDIYAIDHQDSKQDAQPVAQEPADSADSSKTRNGGGTLGDDSNTIFTGQNQRDDQTRSELLENSADIPLEIGRYETISLLGEGAFGIVLKSNDMQLDRLVAIKLAKFNAVSSALAIKRFLGEARSAAQLRHPNIVPVFEYGKSGKHHFIAYQFIEGITFQQILKQGIGHREGVELIIDVCRGLDYAHQQGIIHRDIKPANILIDKKGIPHVADFGCAREIESDEERTVDGSLLGTPAYMSPEVAAGKANQADARTDIWSVGVMLFELLAGQRPFTGKAQSILAMIQVADAPLVRSKNKNVAPALETIVEKCLLREPERRFSSCGELADELQRWLDGRPLLSRRINPIERTWMWAKRNPRWASMWGALAATLLTAFLITTLLLWQLRTKQSNLIQSHLESLLTADAASVPVIIDDLAALDANVQPRLVEMRGTNSSARQALRINLGLSQFTPLDHSSRPQIIDDLATQFLTAEPAEIDVATKLLTDDSVSLSKRLWPTMLDDSKPDAQRLRAALALAQLDPDSTQWSALGKSIVGKLLNEPPESLAVMLPMVRPIGEQLKPALQDVFKNADREETRRQAAYFMAQILPKDFQFLAEQSRIAEPRQLYELSRPMMKAPGAARPIVAKVFGDEPADTTNWQQVVRRANQIVLNVGFGNDQMFRDALNQSDDPTLRTTLIHVAPTAGLKVTWCAEVLDNNRESEFLKVAALQMLGGFDAQNMLWQKNNLKELVGNVFQNHPDPGVHSSADWLLRQWGFDVYLAKIKLAQQSDQPKLGFRWHEDPNGLCFAIFDPVQFRMGKPGTSKGEQTVPFDHQREIPRRFGISTTEMTRKMYLQMDQKILARIQKLADAADQSEQPIWTKRIRHYERSRNSTGVTDATNLPMSNLTWRNAALVCEQLSLEKQLQAGELVYQMHFIQNKSAAYILNPENLDPLKRLQRNGYRMPTSGELEYVTRAACKTKWNFGNQIRWLKYYAWTAENSRDQPHAVAQLKPNHFGFFDVHGNIGELCHDTANYFEPGTKHWIDGQVVQNTKTVLGVHEQRDRSFAFQPIEFAVYDRNSMSEAEASKNVGFRIARTYPAQKQ